MERGSDQHGPRIDEALERATSSMERGSPTDSRAEEGRQQEAPADRERLVEAAVAGHAREPVVEALRRLPSGITYQGTEGVVDRVLGA